MLYWLYTDGRTVLTRLLLPLIALSLVLPPVLCFSLGRGIQRSNGGTRIDGSGVTSLFALLTLGVVNLTVLAGYVIAVSSTAVLHQRSAEPDSARFLAGGPNWVDHERLISLSFTALVACAAASAVLYAGVRNGGWLRERIDRLRRPPVRRGAMGSAHFCTLREYRRFRRPDKDGITLYGAFWGANRWRLEHGFGKFCLNGEDAGCCSRSCSLRISRSRRGRTPFVMT